MKRLSGSPNIFIFTLSLLSAALTTAVSGQTPVNGLPEQLKHDTTGLVRFVLVNPFDLDILPPSSGVRFFMDGIVFLSNTKMEGKMVPKHVSFGSTEAYTATLRDTTLGMHIPFSPTVSFPYPCEAITFSSDYHTMYYTKIGKKEKKEKIYKAVYRSEGKGEPGWITDENPLPFCSGNNIYTHPALSADGNSMIFSSDMQGSSGSLDLFIVKKEGDRWGVPANMGKGVNSTGSECFPYLDQNNNLFFSSDGMGGSGGYDIFSCRFIGDTWDKPMNLSGRVNSENDEIAFSINRLDGRSAFYTTRKKGDPGSAMLRKVTLSQDLFNDVPLTISYIYNGKAITHDILLAAIAAEQARLAAAEPAKPPVEQKKEVKPDEKKAPSATAAKVVTIKNTSELPEQYRDKVIYRVQFLSVGKPRKENQIVINGVIYKTYEYLYLDLYRYTIGEFTTLGPARALQNTVRNAGYPQAFVAAFKNDQRSLDLNLFR